MMAAAMPLTGCSTADLAEGGSSISSVQINVSSFPAFSGESRAPKTRVTTEARKLAWAANDEILLKVTDDNNKISTATATYDGAAWKLGSTLTSSTTTAKVEAYYAPNYEWVNNALTLKTGKTAGTDEMLSYQSETSVDVISGISIAFAARKYCRLSIIADVGKTVTLTSTEFTANDDKTTAANGLTTTADANGNAYFYGTWTGNAKLSPKVDNIEYTKIVANASVALKTYYMNGVRRVSFGDYYFNDGSWGTLEERTGHTPIGVVIYMGDPTENDPTLKRDHPNCTHGVALSLNTISDRPMVWQSSYDANTNISDWIVTYNTQHPEKQFQKIAAPTGKDFFASSAYQEYEAGWNLQGYNNTKAIEAYNAANTEQQQVDVIQTVGYYREDVKAPSTSSDWYLPSAREFYVLQNRGYLSPTPIESADHVYFGMDYSDRKSNTEFINTRITNFGASSVAPLSGYLWTSTEAVMMNNNSLDKGCACVAVFKGNNLSNYYYVGSVYEDGVGYQKSSSENTNAFAALAF
jgi:hypothetical protein